MKQQAGASGSTTTLGTLSRLAARPLVLLMLLMMSVQGLSLVPLLSHWPSVNHSEATEDCHPSAGGADGDSGCDPSCGCLGCPSHGGGLALLNRLVDLGSPAAIGSARGSDDMLNDRPVVHTLFRPPSSPS